MAVHSAVYFHNSYFWALSCVCAPAHKGMIFFVKMSRGEYAVIPHNKKEEKYFFFPLPAADHRRRLLVGRGTLVGVPLSLLR